jgi:hypothetical protein
MTTLYAIFDGEVFRPESPVPLEPNTRVRISIEAEPEKESQSTSFLHTAQGLNLDGPSDWSSRFRELRSETLAHMHHRNG